jgi:hypothetical protein
MEKQYLQGFSRKRRGFGDFESWRPDEFVKKLSKM